jgi:hypothetical protein
VFIEGRDSGVVSDWGSKDGQIEKCGRAKWLTENAGEQGFGSLPPQGSSDIEHYLTECANSNEWCRGIVSGRADLRFKPGDATFHVGFHSFRVHQVGDVGSIAWDSFRQTPT